MRSAHLLNKNISYKIDKKRLRFHVAISSYWAGGNRTPVRKPSTDSSTYLAVLFNLTYSTPTSKQEISELP